MEQESRLRFLLVRETKTLKASIAEMRNKLRVTN